MGELSGVLVCILQVCTVTVNKEQSVVGRIMPHSPAKYPQPNRWTP